MRAIKASIAAVSLALGGAGDPFQGLTLTPACAAPVPKKLDNIQPTIDNYTRDPLVGLDPNQERAANKALSHFLRGELESFAAVIGQLGKYDKDERVRTKNSQTVGAIVDALAALKFGSYYHAAPNPGGTTLLDLSVSNSSAKKTFSCRMWIDSNGFVTIESKKLDSREPNILTTNEAVAFIQSISRDFFADRDVTLTPWRKSGPLFDAWQTKITQKDGEATEFARLKEAIKVQSTKKVTWEIGEVILRYEPEDQPEPFLVRPRISGIAEQVRGVGVVNNDSATMTFHDRDRNGLEITAYRSKLVTAISRTEMCAWGPNGETAYSRGAGYEYINERPLPNRDGRFSLRIPGTGLEVLGTVKDKWAADLTLPLNTKKFVKVEGIASEEPQIVISERGREDIRVSVSSAEATEITTDDDVEGARLYKFEKYGVFLKVLPGKARYGLSFKDGGRVTECWMTREGDLWFGEGPEGLATKATDTYPELLAAKPEKK